MIETSHWAAPFCCYFSCMSPSVYSTGSLVGLFINQRDLIQHYIRPETLLWHPIDSKSFHIAAHCVCIDKTSSVIKKRRAGDPPSEEISLLPKRNSASAMSLVDTLDMHNRYERIISHAIVCTRLNRSNL